MTSVQNEASVPEELPTKGAAVDERDAKGGEPGTTDPARPTTAWELADQIEALVTFQHDGGDDGYEKSADALWKAALLAFNYAADKVGATGFQAGFAALRFYGDAMGIDGPFGIVKAENVVYPQYDEVAKIRGWIENEWRPWIIEQAQKKLEQDNTWTVDRVIEHWRALAAEAPTGADS